MKIVIVGPTHPYKGGIALYTTELAHRLSRAGHDVELISWRAQYPFFYPGKQAGALERPELPLFPRVKLVLSWKNPFGWWRWGRRLRGYDQIIFVWWVPTFQGPAYLTMLRALGRRRPLTAAICHNVLPHEGRPGDKLLARAFLRRMDCLVTHSTAQAELAGQLGGKNIKVAELPLLLSSMPKRPTNRHDLTHELFFFGFVRPYKGVDVLLEALAKVPDVRLTVAGEFWGGTESYEKLIKKLRLQRRVTLHNGYLPMNELAERIGAADAVVLPYKTATSTQHVSLAHAYGTPVIATTAGSLGSLVKDDTDGLLCPPDNAEALAGAIRRFYEPGVAKRLRQGIVPPQTETGWQLYLAAVVV